MQQQPLSSPASSFAAELARNLSQTLEQLPALHAALAEKDARIVELESRITRSENQRPAASGPEPGEPG